MGKYSVKHMIVGCLLFSIVAMMIEVTFTGIGAGPSGNFIGHISLLMAILYWIVFLLSGPLFSLLRLMKLRNLFLRAFVLVFVIYAFEWSFGALCRMAGFVPWDYTGHGWATDFSNGNITLYFAPAWYLYALMIERLVRSVHAAVDGMERAGLLSVRSSRPS